MTRALAVFALLWLGPARALCAFSPDDRGTAAAPFLKLPAGARSAALGEGGLAIGGGAESVFLNPAELADEARPSAFFSHASMFAGMSYQAAAYAQPGAGGVWAASVRHLTSGAIDETDAFGLVQGEFATTDLSAGLAYGRRLGPTLKAGLAANWVRAKIVDSVQTLAVDAALSWRPSKRLTLSAAARNLGGELRFEREGFRLPAVAAAGLAWRATPGLTLTLDAAAPADNAPYAAAGAEARQRFAERWMGSARVGFHTRSLSDGDGVRNVSAGLGLAYASTTSGETISVDYAFQPMGRLGLTHRWSVSLKFGRDEAEAAPKEAEKKKLAPAPAPAPPPPPAAPEPAPPPAEEAPAEGEVPLLPLPE